jgi:hypothetical protein
VANAIWCIGLVNHTRGACVLLPCGITHQAIAIAALFGLVVAGFAVTLCSIAYICNVPLPYATKTSLSAPQA